MYFYDKLKTFFWTGRRAKTDTTSFYEYKYYGSDEHVFTLDQFDSFEKVIEQCRTNQGMSKIGELGTLTS